MGHILRFGSVQLLGVFLLGCATTQASQPASEDPCREVTAVETWWRGSRERDAQCLAHNQEQQQRQLMEGIAAANVEREAEAERQQQEIAKETAEEEAYIQEHQIQVERTRYRVLVTNKDCASTWAESRSRYDRLAGYQSTPERDAAIQLLEGCRQTFAAALRRKLPKILSENRTQFARILEDLFDEKNPYKKGDLVAKVEGTTLRVRHRGNFEGRARHSQTQVNSWCDGEGSAAFSRIVLKNGHGAFSCVPLGWERKRQRAESLLQKALADDPLSMESGSRRTPGVAE